MEAKHWASLVITEEMTPETMQAARAAIKQYGLDKLAKELDREPADPNEREE